MIDVTLHDTVTELRLNRPPVNALDLELLKALGTSLDDQPAERVLVLSAGPGLFSAGLDVRFLLSLDDDGLVEFFESFFAVLEQLVSRPAPVVAAITGHAPAGGLVLALCCDLRLMARGEFKIGLNEVNVGLPIPLGVVALASHAVGPRRAEKMCVSGRLMGPEAALEWGLVDELVDPEDLVERALTRAAELAAAPPLAMRLTREAVRADLVARIRRCREIDPGRILTAWNDPGTQKALAALLARIS